MATVSFYTLIFLISTFFVYISDKGKGALERKVFLCLAFLIFFVPSAIRYDIGTDYLNYVDIYENIEYHKYIEPAYYYLNLGLNLLGADSQWVFIISAFIFSFVSFKSYPTKNAWIIHVALMGMLWFFSFNVVRQAIAISFCLLAISKFLNGQPKYFFVLTLIASLFHTSAILIFITGMISFIPLNRKIKNSIIPIIFILIILSAWLYTNIFLEIVDQVLSLLNLNKYAGYFGGIHFIEADFGSGLGALARILFSSYIIFNTKSFLALGKNYWLLILLVFFYAFGIVLADNIIIFGRFADTFVIGPIVSTYVLYNLTENKQKHRTVVYIFLIYLLLNFIKDSFGEKTSYADPKRNPYQTIFHEKY